MMKNNRTILFYVVLVFTFIFSSAELFSQESSSNAPRNLYIYGFIDNTIEKDSTKLQLCTDLFYSQFESTQKFSLYDKRTTAFNQDLLETHKESSDILFYHTISQTESDWTSTLHLVDLETNKEASITKNYKDFYKILMDAKNSLTELLTKQTSDSIDQQIATAEKETITYTITDMYGTWKGEENIHKIVILSAGRGFVIFENGSSMNVSVEVKNQSLFVEQDCTTSADFFPDIPREIAIELALTAEPITWDFEIEDLNTLNGVKNTYAIVDTQTNTIDNANITVTWYR